jgi:NAD(P)H-dependent FMN reductase
LFVVPEYNFGVNAATKNAIDYLNMEWCHKAVGFVSYGGVSGGTRAVQMLRAIVPAVKMVPVSGSIHLPFITDMLDDNGMFVSNIGIDTAARSMLDELCLYNSVLEKLRGNLIA